MAATSERGRTNTASTRGRTGSQSGNGDFAQANSGNGAGTRQGTAGAGGSGAASAARKTARAKQPTKRPSTRAKKPSSQANGVGTPAKKPSAAARKPSAAARKPSAAAVGSGERRSGGAIARVLVPALTGAAGVAGGILLGRNATPRRRTLFGVPVPEVRIDLRNVSGSIAEAGRQLGRLASEVHAAREKVEKLGRAIG